MAFVDRVMRDAASLRVRNKPLLLRRRYDNRLAPGQCHHFGVRYPIRRENQDFIARIEDRVENVVQTVLGSA